MFDCLDSGIGLWPGEGPEDLAGEDQLCFELTCREPADGWSEEGRRHVLPHDLEDVPVGPFLAAIVSSVDVSRVEGHDAVRLMRARARLVSHHEAGKLEAMREVAFCSPADPGSGIVRSSDEVECAAMEVAAALVLTRRSSHIELSRAVSLCTRLRRVWEVFSRGELDLARVRIFDDMLGHLPVETVEEVLDRVLEDAPGLTTGQLRARLGRLVLEVDPDGSKSCYEEGLSERNVMVSVNPDHTANYQIFSSSPQRVVAARDHVEVLARGLKTAGESRSLDQLRADVALDLLAGRVDAGGGGGRVNITVSAEMLAGLADHPGDLEGYGPVFAEIARKTVIENVDGEWGFVVTDQGRPVATGTLARRPAVAQGRRIRAEYPTCVFPGCRMPTHQCDLDHRRPVSQGGPTHNDNLGPLCRYHHMGRHHAPWQLVRKPSGDHEWTSPLGHTYTRKRAPPS